MKKVLLVVVLLCVITALIFVPQIVSAAQYTQYIKSGISAFPADYQEKLKALSQKYPNWNFQAYYTGIDWNELIEKERGNEDINDPNTIHRNRVNVNSDLSWKHCDFEANGYACASDAIVAYYLDPRNFLNEQNIFQFVESSYNEKQQTVETIQKTVEGTFLDTTITCKDFNGNDVTMSYAEMIVEAAKQSNVSAFYIKSKIVQEVGVNGSGSVSGTYPGYEGYYNFYNYGAHDTGDPIANGLAYAKDQGWDSQYKAIIGGAKLIATDYINAGQNTAYFNKWDVVGTKILKDGESQVVNEENLFWHQYMTNIQDPTNQSYSNYELYKDILNNQITFIIPVYNNMPESNPQPHDIKLESISLYTTELNLQVGEEATTKTGWIGAAYTPSNATDKVLYWSSSNENVAKVSEGTVTAVGEGTATITARSRDGNKTATCTVTVTKIDKALQSIKMNQESIELDVGDEGWVGVTYNPSDASDKVLYWTSNNTNIATVSEGTIKAIGRGTATLTATSRDGSKTATCKVTVNDPNFIELQSITMNSTMKLKVGETGWLGVTYNPSNASDKVLYWTSSNENVAKVSEGTVTAVGEGTATITATSRDGNKTAECKLTVNSKDFVDLESITMDSTMKLKPGETGWLGVTYNPSNATDKVLYWTSSDEKVAKVSEGTVTAVGEGTATLTATSRDGGKTATCIVTVDNGIVELESISLKTTSLTMKPGESTTIYVTYNPSNVTDKVLYWKSSNENVARVSEGNVTAVGAGTATITATSRDGGKTATCTVTVGDGTISLQSLSLKTTSLTMKPGESTTIYAVYNPSNVTDKVLYWSSSNTNVARVSEGNVTAIGNGTATITATSRDGGKTATCTVTVGNGTVSLQKLTLNSSMEILTKGSSKTIYATYNPSNVTDKVLYWSSSNTNVARVSEGNVTAVGNGITTITATSRDGGKTASCQIIVVDKNTEMKSISLKTTNLTMNRGESAVIYATYNPSNVTDKVIYWVSSNTNVARVSEGTVTAVGKGTATITAITKDGGKVATCEITVSN